MPSAAPSTLAVESVVQLPNIFGCDNTNKFATGPVSRQAANYSFTQQFGLLQAMPRGSQHTVNACINGMSTSHPFNTNLDTATHVDAVLLDDHIYTDWLKVRVAVQVRDSDFNTRTSRNRVYITAMGAISDTRTASCRPSATQGTCVATIDAPSNWLTGGPVSVMYGLSSDSNLQSLLGVTTPIASPPAVYQDNLLAHVPSRPLRAGEQFDMTIDARAPNDVESAKFTLFLQDTSVLEIVGVPTGLNDQVWSYQFVVRADGFTAVLNRKPDASPVTQQAQDQQQLVQARVRVKSATVSGQSAMQLRVQELNAPTPISPGGQQIPEGGFVLGNVLGRIFSLHSAGSVHVVDDEVVALFGVPDGGTGTIVNTAPLTGVTTEIRLEGWEVFRYGTTLRQAGVTACSILGGAIANINVAVDPSGQATCLIELTADATVGDRKSVV